MTVDEMVSWMRKNGVIRYRTEDVELTIDPRFVPDAEGETPPRGNSEEDIKRQERAEKLHPFRHVRLT